MSNANELLRGRQRRKSEMTMLHLSTRGVFVVWLVLNIAVGVAHPVAEPDTLHVRNMESAKVRARQTPRSVLAGKPVQTMDRQEIEALGIHNLSDAVRKFAGTNVRDYGGIGGMKTVSVRNLGAHHTAVSLDGVPVSNTQAGQIDVGRYGTDHVSLISLSVGDAEELMLSARHFASAAVLAIETERPLFENGKSYVVQQKIRGGSFGLINPEFYYGGRIGRRVVLTAEADYMRADGTYPFTLRNANNLTHEKRYNSDIYSWRGEANLFCTLGDSSECKVKAGYYYSDRGLPGAVIFYASPSEQRLWDEDFFAQTVYRKHFSDRFSLRSSLKYAHSWNRYEDPKAHQYDVDRQNEYYVSVTGGWNPVKHFEVALAEDVAFNDLSNNIIMNVQDHPANPHRFTTLSSLSARYRLGPMDLHGNLVGTYATESVKAGEEPHDKRRLSPSLSATFRLLRQESFFLRLMYKDAYRMPTFNDLYYRRMGNAGLQPEKARMYNVGLTWSGRPCKLMNYLSATVDGYYNHVHDKIVAFPTTYVWRMANFGRTTIRGIDATLATEWPLVRDKVSATLTGAYTWQKATDLSNPKSQTYKNRLPYTPDRNGSISLMINNPWVNVGYGINYCGMRYSMGQNKPEYAISSYAEHTLTLTREFSIASHRLSLQGSIVNLTNKQYEIIKYYPMPRRSWNVTAKWYL